MRILTFRGYVLLIVLGLTIALVLTAGTGRAQEMTMRHATGTFTVTVTPADPEVVQAGLGLSRYTLAKTFEGGLTGTGTGQMLAGGVSAETGAYVAMERVVGTLDGREGAFLLAHRGDMTPDGFSLSITVVPNSGTGALTGLTGDFALTITGGVHHYDLAYSLPGA
ncbi:DUF3224 domain-containing protein [Brevundimonas sp. R86498]|uniref:DUF3224 domain-containing protein n=1 Tax=Brevundimonas sp. R86498 TaxID=3093845 RepID=UPI0037C65C45